MSDDSCCEQPGPTCQSAPKIPGLPQKLSVWITQVDGKTIGIVSACGSQVGDFVQLVSAHVEQASSSASRPTFRKVDVVFVHQQPEAVDRD